MDHTPAPPASPRSALLPALAVFILSLLLTLAAWDYTRRTTAESTASRFETRIAQIHSTLTMRMLAYAQALKGAQVMIGQTRNPDREQWSRLYRTLRLADSYPGFVALVHIRAIPGTDLQAVLAEERKNEPDLKLYPPGERPFLAMVTAIEPRSPRNLLAIGSDSWANLSRRAAMIRARDTGESHISGKVQLVIDREDSIPAFLMYQAVYAGGVLPESETERELKLQGFVLAGFRLNALIEGTFPEGLNDVAMEVHDGEAGQDSLFYSSHPGESLQALSIRRSKPLQVGGRTWTIQYGAKDNFALAVEKDQPNRILIIGTLISILLLTLTWAILSARTRAIQIAEKMTRSLRESETKLRALFAQAPLGIFALDRRGTVIDCNARAAAFISDRKESPVGSNFLEKQRNTPLAAPIQSATEGQPVSTEICREQAQGKTLQYCQYHFQPVYIDGELNQVIGFCEDISARKEAESQLAFLAHHDPLTGLGNRTLLDEDLHAAIALAQAGSGLLCLIFLDLDHFKTVNDTLGHSVGDALLVQIAHRLQDGLRGQASLYRVGGDEFVIIHPHLTCREDSAPLLDRLHKLIKEPLEVRSHVLTTTASAGIACWPGDGLTPEQLNQSADTAMYFAKNAGRDHYRFFTPEMQTQVQADAKLDKELRRALEKGEFQLYYQEQNDGSNSQIIGAEALIRWFPPGQPMVPPDRFIPFAEERGHIIPIGEWVIQEACRQIRIWRDAGLVTVPVAINLSARQFRVSNLRAIVEQALSDFRLEPECLLLEITESAVMDDPECAAQILDELVSMGLRVEIDDFGTGYSSLASLKRFPIQRLKIDRSFVSNIPQDSNDVAIVDAILQVASSLGIHVIAEGVETAEQVDHLLEHGCHAMQGYYFGRPAPAADFAARLEAGGLVSRLTNPAKRTHN